MPKSCYMEVTTKPKIFIHSWLSDDLLYRLKKNFDIDHHDTAKSILSGKELLDRVIDVDGILVQLIRSILSLTTYALYNKC